MRILALFVLSAVLTACSDEAPQTTTGQTQVLQCGKDTDCKGDRICDAGVCKNPNVQASVVPQDNAATASIGHASMPPAPDNADTELQAALIAALRQKPGTDERIGSSGDAILAYANAGYVAKKPDFREDYSDYRVLKKPTLFMGHTLVAIEEEYFQEYVGCCVSPGMAVTVRVSPNGEDLDAFASRNGCSVSRDSDDHYSSADIGLPKAPKGTYVTLSCKDRDLSGGA